LVKTSLPAIHLGHVHPVFPADFLHWHAEGAPEIRTVW
jgi:hypothetical protein